MKILAGTGRGVFAIADHHSRHVLESRGVRDLIVAGGRCLAGTGAGVYISDDAGESFTLSGLADYEVWQIRQAPSGALFAGTQPAALFRSDDNGDSWQELESFRRAPGSAGWCLPVKPPLPPRARAIVIDQQEPLRMWIGVEVGGILRTDDGGETWAPVLPGDNPDLHMMCARPDSPDILFASTGYGRLDGVAEMIEGNAGVFRSEDGGATWRYAWRGITPRYSRPMCIDPRAPFSLTVASAPTAFSSFRDSEGAGAMLFRSDDMGESWRSLGDEQHAPARENFHGLIPDPDIPDAVLVGTDTGEVWQVNAAAQWSMVAGGMPAVLSLATIG